MSVALTLNDAGGLAGSAEVTTNPACSGRGGGGPSLPVRNRRALVPGAPLLLVLQSLVRSSFCSQ